MKSRTMLRTGAGVFLALLAIAVQPSACSQVLAQAQSNQISSPDVVRAQVEALLGAHEDAASPMARTLAHETGHSLGLFHTTEASGVDPLPDTPQCTRVPYRWRASP